VVDSRFSETVRKRVDEHLRKNGVHRHRDLLGVTELILTLIIYLVSTYKSSVEGSFLWAAMLGVTTGRLGFLMHTGNHMGFSGYPMLNYLAGSLMDLAGGSSIIWSFEHNVAHHMDPNTLHRDNDCSIGDPLLRFHPRLRRRWWHRYQHITTYIVMTFGFYRWLVADFLILADRRVGSVSFAANRSDEVKLVVFKLRWIVCHVVVPWVLFGWWRMFALMFVALSIGAHYLENIFIVNHIQEDLVPSKDVHWAVAQVSSTANWSSGSYLSNWLSGGLNHQVEHHLFPAYSYYNYPLIAPIVQQTCADFNLPYNNYPSFGAAWMATASFLKSLGEKKEGEENEENGNEESEAEAEAEKVKKGSSEAGLNHS